MVNVQWFTIKLSNDHTCAIFIKKIEEEDIMGKELLKSSECHIATPTVHFLPFSSSHGI